MVSPLSRTLLEMDCNRLGVLTSTTCTPMALPPTASKQSPVSMPPALSSRPTSTQMAITLRKWQLSKVTLVASQAWQTMLASREVDQSSKTLSSYTISLTKRQACTKITIWAWSLTWQRTPGSMASPSILRETLVSLPMASSCKMTLMEFNSYSKSARWLINPSVAAHTTLMTLLSLWETVTTQNTTKRAPQKQCMSPGDQKHTWTSLGLAKSASGSTTFTLHKGSFKIFKEWICTLQCTFSLTTPDSAFPATFGSKLSIY